LRLFDLRTSYIDLRQELLNNYSLNNIIYLLS